MKPAPFAYVRPDSVEEACALLARDEDARIIAGGQTLVPMLAMRLARPTVLVDILRIESLAGIRETPDSITIGATTRQVDIEHSPLIAARLPLLAKAMPWVGHPPTRNRGTIGGSIANADPAAEIPLVAVTLGAEIVSFTADGPEVIAADEFFIGPMLTAAPAAGCVTEIRWPVWQEPRLGVAFHEISARRGDFAFVAAAAQVSLDAAGVCTGCAVGIGGVGDRPVRLQLVNEALVGSKLDDPAIREAMAAAVEDLEANSDLHASAEYRRRVARTLAARALGNARDAAAGVKP
jgi:CO/xanthine dehydrogenase FAD-binding subunit